TPKRLRENANREREGVVEGARMRNLVQAGRNSVGVPGRFDACDKWEGGNRTNAIRSQQSPNSSQTAKAYELGVPRRRPKPSPCEHFERHGGRIGSQLDKDAASARTQGWRQPRHVDLSSPRR